MHGCHIARVVEERLQKGLRFRFRESQELSVTQKFLSFKDLSLRSMIVLSTEISGAGGAKKV